MMQYVLVKVDTFLGIKLNCKYTYNAEYCHVRPRSGCVIGSVQ